MFILIKNGAPVAVINVASKLKRNRKHTEDKEQRKKRERQRKKICRCKEGG